MDPVYATASIQSVDPNWCLICNPSCSLMRLDEAPLIGGYGWQLDAQELESESWLQAGTSSCADLAIELQNGHHNQQQQYLQIGQALNPAHKRRRNKTNMNEMELNQVELFGVALFSLTIKNQERISLDQLATTILKDFKFIEIRRARRLLGIKCNRCSKMEQDLLKRYGLVSGSTTNCATLTIREAVLLCRCLLFEKRPIELPEDFYFIVTHRLGNGCSGRFIPTEYTCWKAKCIACFRCGEYYSPCKFLRHSHKELNHPCNSPLTAFNSKYWRRQLFLDPTQEQNEEIKYAWEQVLLLFSRIKKEPKAAREMQTANDQ